MDTGSATCNTCTIDLVQHKRSKLPQTTESLLKKIEQENPHIRQHNSNDPSARFAQPKGQIPSAQLHGRLNEHEDHFGGRVLPRGALPKIDGALMDRYQAVRRNMMMLGALAEHKQPPPKPGKLTRRLAAAAAAAGTERSSTGSRDDGAAIPRLTRSSASSVDASTADDDLDDDGASSVAPSEMGAKCARRSLDSGCNSFKSGRSTARLNRSDSRASRVSRASYDDDRGRTPDGSVARVRGRHLRKSTSQLSGHSSGTLRSVTSCGTSRTARSRYSARRRSGGHAKVRPKPGRVTRALREFGGQDDWVNKVLLRHFLAAVIQARWKGYVVRRRMRANAAKFIEEEKARLGLHEELDAGRSVHSAGTSQSTGVPHSAGSRQHNPRQPQHPHLQHQQSSHAHHPHHQQQHPHHQLQHHHQQQHGSVGGAAGARRGTKSRVPQRGAADRAAARQHSSVSARTGSASKGASSSAGGLVGLGAGCRSSQEAYVAHMRLASAQHADSDASDSEACSSDGWSDVDIEDITAVKFRARTPPWQRAEENAARARLLMLQRPAPSTCMLWDISESEQRLTELRQRRLQRPPDPVQLSPSAVAAAEASGLSEPWRTGADGDANPCALDAAELPLPKDIVHTLLQERYREKYARLPELMPGSKHSLASKHW